MGCVRISRYAALLLLGACCAAGQESIQYGSISGSVEDASGAVIQGAKVSCRQQETNIGTSLLTDKEGRFRFRYLSAGEYEIVVQQPDFSETRRFVNVGLGSAFDLPIVLTVAASQNEVTVSARADLLEAARTQIAGTINQAEVNNLPLNGRNFLDLALLVPGVSPTKPGKPEKQIGSGKDITIALSGGKTYVAWVEGTKVQVLVDGKIEELAPSGAFPSLSALTSGGAIAAWEQNGSIQFRRLP